MKRLFLALWIFLPVVSFPQEFVKVNNSLFTLEGEPFYFLGFNAYYLQSEAAKGNTYIVDETIAAANELNAPVIRTWAFYEGDPDDTCAIRFSPYSYNEKGLRALDYIVYKAKEQGVKLILTLANNFSDFGGIAKYIDWADTYLNGAGYSHNDFFSSDTLKTWYKNYVSEILNRKNAYTGITYKDEPAIFSFELMNEAASAGAFGKAAIKDWYEEMSAYFKQIDTNHLLTTGEIGYDERTGYYHDADMFYNSGYFLLNGYKGTSYYENSSIENIDYSSYHLYPSGWSVAPESGITWISDHISISEDLGKPALLGEFGLKNGRAEYYKKWLTELNKHRVKSALVWQYQHPDVMNNDGYGFNTSDEEMKSVFSFYSNLLEEINDPIIPSTAVLYQNYPNPFNPSTTISYSLPEDSYVSLDLYDILGRHIANLDSGYKKMGKRELTLSFNNSLLSSGVYIYTLRTSRGTVSKKLTLLK